MNQNGAFQDFGVRFFLCCLENSLPLPKQISKSHEYEKHAFYRWLAA